MECEVVFTRAATDEAARMLMRWWDWPLFLFQHLYGLLLVCALLYGGCSLFIRSLFRPQPDIPHAALGLLLVIAVPAFAWWTYRRAVRKDLDHLASLNPLRYTFDSEGVHTRVKNGEINFTPWATFNGFREGKHVLLLLGPKKRNQVISKNTLVPGDAERLRSAVRSRLPQIQ